LASVEKELQQAKTDNAALVRYINSKRKTEEDQRKEEACKKRRRAKAPKAHSLLLARFQ
jgi:hypothetical protein